MSYRTIEFPILSQEEFSAIGQESCVERLFLLYLYTRDFDIKISNDIGPFKAQTVITDELREQLRPLFPGNMEDWRNVIRICTAAKSSMVASNYSPYLFKDTCKENPQSKREGVDSDFKIGKLQLLQYRSMRMLPFKLPEVLSSANLKQAMDHGIAAIKSHIGQRKLLAENRHKKLTEKAEGDSKNLEQKAKDFEAANPDIIRFYEFLKTEQLIGHAIRRSKGKKIPEDVEESFKNFNVDWNYLRDYLDYRKIVDWSVDPAFNHSVQYCGRIVFETSGNFHSIKKAEALSYCFNMIGTVNGRDYRIETAGSQKWLDVKIEKKEDFSIEYTENNSRRRQRTGRLQQAAVFKPGYLQLVANVDPIIVNGYDPKESEEIARYFRTSLPTSRSVDDDKSNARASLIREGMTMLAIDIGCYPMIAYSVMKISFINPSDCSSELADGRTAYLHFEAGGRIGEKFNYDQIQDLINRTRDLKSQIKEGKFEKRAANFSFSQIKAEMSGLDKAFQTCLSSDHIKYLEFIDEYIQAVKSAETIGLTTEETLEINRNICPDLKSRRANIRKDLSNKILFEIVNLCLDYKVAICCVEDFASNYHEDDRKWKNRLKIRLRMQGFSKIIEARLKEYSVSIVEVSPEYTSKTWRDSEFGIRLHKEGFIRILNGLKCEAVDDDINAADNIGIRAFTRHRSLHACYADWNGNKLFFSKKNGKRRQGAYYAKFGEDKELKPLDLESLSNSNRKTCKVYWFNNQWTATRPEVTLKAQFASNEVVS